MSMRRSGLGIALAPLFVALAGCWSPPRLFHPGPAAVQQKNAVQFAPFADNNIGPEIVGARPRDYDKPISEPARARWVKPNTFQ
jgi:hypothetical protein